MSEAADYLPGSVKVHPNWPDVLITAHRTQFEDNDLTSCSSWMKVQPVGGTGFLYHFQVDAWPDAAGLTRLAADQVVVPPQPAPAPAEEPPAEIVPDIPVPTAEDFAAAGLGDGTPSTTPTETPTTPEVTP